jgi:hypothetical protein
MARRAAIDYLVILGVTFVLAVITAVLNIDILIAVILAGAFSAGYIFWRNSQRTGT